MRAVVQRATYGSVSVNDNEIGRISQGLVVLIGVAREDGPEDVQYITDKIAGLRIFEDEQGKMNRSVMDIGGGILAVSQFTLFGDTRKGRRPSFTEAAEPEKGLDLFNRVVESLKSRSIPVSTGAFGQHMMVELVNDGPVTILLDSQRKF